MQRYIDTTHPYKGMGEDYAKARKGTPDFAQFMVKNSGLVEATGSKNPLLMVEFGVGGGQQTEFVEKELSKKSITNYTILGMDKSFGISPEGNPGQLEVLKSRIESGEISSRVIPYPHDLDRGLLLAKNSVDLGYAAFVIHHLKSREGFFDEVRRIAKKGSRFFVFGASLEDLADHPLNEFFPDKASYDAMRYPTREQIKNLFENAGFEHQQPYPILRDDDKPIDEAFLVSVENKTINSVLVMIADDNPGAFSRGLERVRNVVEEGIKSGTYRRSNIYRTIDWGIKT